MYSTYFRPFPQFETDRLILRKVKRRDAEDLYKYCSSPDSVEFANWEPHESISVTRQYISWLLMSVYRGEYMTWCIQLKSTGKVIGTCSITEIDAEYKIAEIGYGICKEYWGNGYVTEALKSVMDYLFCTVGVVRVFVRIMKGNVRSVSLAERIGMKYEGLLRKGVYCKYSSKDIYIYGITDDDYKKIIKNS